MGSYDTGECTITPTRRSSTIRSSPSTDSSPTRDHRTEPETTEDLTLPAIVALGGGLTPARIVKKIPEEMKDKYLVDVINYLKSPEIATTKEEVAILEAIEERMKKPDYRVIINNFYNFHNEKLETDKLSDYLTQKERQTEEGSVKINFCDIAIVSHDEGGKSLEKRLCK